MECSFSYICLKHYSSHTNTFFFTDIEDKGTSGETFLAAVEYLEQEQPAVALFENVDKAPWAKMQEYIWGRLNLSERNSIKNITEIKQAQAGECTKLFDTLAHLTSLDF